MYNYLCYFTTYVEYINIFDTLSLRVSEIAGRYLYGADIGFVRVLYRSVSRFFEDSREDRDTFANFPEFWR